VKPIFVSALALAIATPALAQNAAPVAAPTAAEADVFVAAAEKEYFDYSVFARSPGSTTPISPTIPMR
jgi:hypothetical protein